MKITVNGKPTETQQTKLADLLIELGHESMHVATAVNESFIPVSARITQTLQVGDRVEIVAPRQGG